MNYKKKYSKYKNKYLELKQKLLKQVGGGTGRDIIEMLNKIIEIHDSSGISAVQDYFKSNNITIHQDSTNTSSIESNIGNIRNVIGMFNKKYFENLEEGYTDFDDFAIGDYVCIDAKISVLTDFLIIDHPFKSNRPKEQILGLALSKLTNDLCIDPKSNNINFYRQYNNIDNVKMVLTHIFSKYIPKYITKEEINGFVDAFIYDYVDTVEQNILDCDGKYEELRKIDKNKKMVKKDVSIITDMQKLEIGTILLDINDDELGKLLFDHHFPKHTQGFTTCKGYILKSNIKSIIVKE